MSKGFSKVINLSSVPSKVVERFWDRVAIGGKHECWEWQAGRNSNKKGFDYGLFWVPGIGGVLAHRLAYAFHYGTLTALETIHSCDNPPCCNPLHLSAATHCENMRDRWNKSRYATAERGVDRYNSKLNDDKVREIRRLLQLHRDFQGRMDELKKEISRTSRKAIAKQFGVDPAIILLISRNQAWKHVK